MGDERILGSSDFVEAVLKRTDEDCEGKTLARAKGLDIDFVVSEVSKYFDIKPEFIKGAG